MHDLIKAKISTETFDIKNNNDKEFNTYLVIFSAGKYRFGVLTPHITYTPDRYSNKAKFNSLTHPFTLLCIVLNTIEKKKMQIITLTHSNDNNNE